ncbi:MAG: MFS transporter [Mycobacteriaceae bacterium]|nr:MFS transporter [Mycobacteriaceae bacterium]
MTDAERTKTSTAIEASPSRFLIPLLVITGAQLLVVLNDVIANVGLRPIQHDLDMSPATLPWVVNSYILVFGALLLFGGRAGDLYGRRRVLQVGIVLFALGALLAGLAPNGTTVILGRGLQGLGAALTAPNALASITTTFAPGKHRNLAMAMYAAMSGLGIAIGLLLGGLLTGTLGWSWMFFINVPIAVLLLLGTRTLLEAEPHPGRLDVTGAVLGTAAMASLVYAITRGGEHGWADTGVIGFLTAAAALMVVFLVVQSRMSDPLLPLHIFNNRNRSGAYLAMLLLAIGPLGTFYLLNLYLQYVLGYTPLQTGLAWLPFAVGIILGAGVSSNLVTRFAPRVIVGAGMMITALGVLSLSFIGTDPSYWTHLLPAIFATAFGFALNFVPLISVAVESVDPPNSGVASALLNTAQQIGAALGIAVVSSIAVAVTHNGLPNALGALIRGRDTGDAALVADANNALIHGYSTGLLVGAIILVVAAIVTAAVINAKRPEQPPSENLMDESHTL